MTIPPKSLMIGTCEIASHYPELSLNDAAGDALQLAESSSHAWGSLKASFRKGRFPPHTREGNREFHLSFHYVRLSLHRYPPLTGSPEPKASGCLPYTHVGNRITAFRREYCERSSPHPCGRPDAGEKPGEEKKDAILPSLHA